MRGGEAALAKKHVARNFDPFAFSSYKLSGGLPVYYNLDLSFSAILVGAVFFSGSRDEPEEKAGLAHFMEHVPFRGTAVFPTKVALAAPIENRGGAINAQTSHEQMVFYVNIVPEDLALGLKVLADIIFRARIGKRDFEDEFSAVIDELGNNLSDPLYVTSEESKNRLFRGHPLGHSPLGTAKSLKALRLADVRNFYESRIKNGSFALVVLGHANKRMVLERLEATFGRVRPHAWLRQAVAFKQSEKEEVILKNRPYPRTHLFLSSTSFSAADGKNVIVADVFETMLANGLSSPLFQALREDKGLLYDYNFSCDSWSDAGIIWFSASAAMRNVRRIRRIFFETVERVAVDKRRFALAKKMTVKAGRLKEWTSMDILEETAEYMAHAGKLPLLRNEEEARIAAVTHDDIRRFAETYLDKKRFLTLILKGQIE